MSTTSDEGANNPPVNRNGKIVGWLGAAGAIVVALTYLLDAVPKFITSTQKSYQAFHGLVAPSNPAGNSLPGVSPPSSSNSGSKASDTPSAYQAIQPKPHPDCVLASSSDLSSYPPKYSTKWSCP